MKHRVLVALESPYAGDVERNTRYARACMADSISRGEAPFAMHLLYTQPGILDDKIPEERVRGIECGLNWAQAADLTAVYADLGVTPGMVLAIEQAKKDMRPVDERSLPAWANGDPLGKQRPKLEESATRK